MSLQDTYQDCKDLIATNLTTMGVTSVTGEDGLTTLANAILNVPSGGGGGTITLSSNKTEIIQQNSETATITANYSEGAGATLKLYINDIQVGTMTDAGSGTYTYTYTALGNGTLKIYVKVGNTISNTLYITDYLKKGVSTTETWHQINNTNTMTVTDGVATGFNKLLDYSWDNSKDWVFTCKYKADTGGANGLIFADVTNTNNFDYNSFTILQNQNRSVLSVTGHTGNTLWTGVNTNVNSREYVDVKITNINGMLSFYLNDTFYTSHLNITDVTNICVGMYSWQNATGSFKDITIRYGGDTMLIDKIYPIGSIYMSTSSTSPSTLFGGTWEQLKDKFILGAGNTYNAGDTGGEATHKLTIDEMPTHLHDTSIHNHQSGGGTSNVSRVQWEGSENASSVTVKTATRGGDGSHNNMPPYLVVYMWKRTA